MTTFKPGDRIRIPSRPEHGGGYYISTSPRRGALVWMDKLRPTYIAVAALRPERG